nr:glucosamine-6-phosphate isomerase [Maliibacterium massiliense]
MTDYSNVSRAELLAQTRIPLEILETEEDIYHDMARVMLQEVRTNNAAGKNTVMIVPVGPVFQYRRFARLANMEQLDLSGLTVINMDEYLTDDKKWIDADHPLSFRGFMQRDFYGLLQGKCRIPEENRVFPEPGNEGAIAAIIQARGGVDLAMGGVGICGHIAFNEALDPGEAMSNEAFAGLPTRVLPLTRETRTINAVTGLGGYIDGMPKWCITVGMRDILGARRIRFYMNRPWQRGIVRKACLDPVSGHTPVTFFQQHPDAKLIIASYVADPPQGEIR